MSKYDEAELHRPGQFAGLRKWKRWHARYGHAVAVSIRVDRKLVYMHSCAREHFTSAMNEMYASLR